MSDSLYCVLVSSDASCNIYQCSEINVLQTEKLLRVAKRKSLKPDKQYTIVRVRISSATNKDEFIDTHIFKSRKKAAKHFKREFMNNQPIWTLLGKYPIVYTKKDLSISIAYYIRSINNMSLPISANNVRLNIDVYKGKLISGNCPNHIRTDMHKCAICIEKESNVAIIPCGHICGCLGCLISSSIHECPICRGRKIGILKVYQAGICETDV